MAGNGFDRLISTLRGLAGSAVEVEVNKRPITAGVADGFHEGEAVFGVVSFFGRLSPLRRSSRETERWYLEIRADGQLDGYVTVSIDASALEWAEFSEKSLAFGQEGLIYSVDWD